MLDGFLPDDGWNEWLVEIIDWHFNEMTGSPYWLEKQKKLGINARRKINSLDDLEVSGCFDEKVLSEVDVRRLVPKGFSSQHDIHVFETGGSTFSPKRVIDVSYRNTLAKWESSCLDNYGFRYEANWLFIGPTGPHVIGYTVGLLASQRRSLCYYIDFDPRWIKRCLANGQKQIANEYVGHIIDQSNQILKTQRIAYIFTTPKILEELINRIDFKEFDIQGVVCGGTEISSDTYNFLKKEYFSEIPFVIFYGNTLGGVAIQHPSSASGESNLISYYPFSPYCNLAVVDPTNPFYIQPYNKLGRVRLTTLTKEMFIPNLLERDQAIRIPPADRSCSDGIANVSPYEHSVEMCVQGVY